MSEKAPPNYLENEIRRLRENNSFVAVETRLRELRDNDVFVVEVWSILSAYQEVRADELAQMPLEDAKDNSNAVLAKLDELAKAMTAVNRRDYLAGGYPPKFDKYLEEMRSYWIAHREKLEGVHGRSTKQESLLWLAEKLTDIFSTWIIPKKRWAGFIEKVTAVILPDGTAPSRRSIDTAIKQSRK